MRIKSSDDERLVIVHFPLFLAVVGFGGPVALVLAFSGLLGGIPTDWKALFCAALFSLGWAALFACFVKRSVYDFDLLRRELVWSQRGIYGKKEGILPFDRIRSAVVHAFSSGDGTGTAYRAVLSLDKGVFPLTSYFDRNTEDHQRVVAAINKALKKNIASGLEDEILDLAASGRRIPAIQMVRKRYGYDLVEASKFVDGLIERCSKDS